MKVISGKYKGRNLLGYNIDGTRPTMDRVKESIFSMLQSKINDSICLDLFAGSGNLGIEALSEGAKCCYFVDHNKKAISVLKENINNIGIDNCFIVYNDYLKALDSFNVKFDIIFLDPPYNSNYIEKSIDKIIDNDLLSEFGLIVCESDSIDRIVYPDCLEVVKDKKYGDKYVVFLRKM